MSYKDLREFGADLPVPLQEKKFRLIGHLFNLLGNFGLGVVQALRLRDPVS